MVNPQQTYRSTRSAAERNALAEAIRTGTAKLIGQSEDDPTIRDYAYIGVIYRVGMSEYRPGAVVEFRPVGKMVVGDDLEIRASYATDVGLPAVSNAGVAFEREPEHRTADWGCW